MQISAVQLERYFFEQLAFAVDPEFDANEPQYQELLSAPVALEHLRTEVELAVNPHNIRQRAYTLSLSTQAEAGNLPYSFQARVVGYFQIGEECLDENVNRMGDVQAASVLYGVVREAVATITGRGPWPPVTLPTVHFANLSFSPPEVEVDAEVEPVAKALKAAPDKAAAKRKSKVKA